MTLNPLIKKLGLKPGMRGLILSAPPGFLHSLSHLPEGITVGDSLEGSYDFIQLFARVKFDIDKIAQKLTKSAFPNGLLWITYPKKTSGVPSDLSREIVWAAMEPTGWRPVTQIAIDDVWSALRFRPAELVKSSSSHVRPKSSTPK